MSIGTDSWSTVTQDGYITLTAHYMTSDWKLCTRVLNTHALESLKTFDALKKELSIICIKENWNLNDKLLAVIHSNATNVGNIANAEDATDATCAVHTLQLSVQAGLKIDAIDKLLSATGRLVGHFRHSPLATHICFNQKTT